MLNKTFLALTYETGMRNRWNKKIMELNEPAGRMINQYTQYPWPCVHYRKLYGYKCAQMT